MSDTPNYVGMAFWLACLALCIGGALLAAWIEREEDKR